MKARQHLREQGEITDTPKDIGALMREANADLLKEEAEAMREQLFAWAWKGISRAALAGLPDWYKGVLLEQQVRAVDAEES